MKDALLLFLLDRIKSEARSLSQEGLDWSEREQRFETICDLVGRVKNLVKE